MTGNMIQRHKEGIVEMALSDRAASSKNMLREVYLKSIFLFIVFITVYFLSNDFS